MLSLGNNQYERQMNKFSQRTRQLGPAPGFCLKETQILIGKEVQSWKWFLKVGWDQCEQNEIPKCLDKLPKMISLAK